MAELDRPLVWALPKGNATRDGPNGSLVDVVYLSLVERSSCLALGVLGGLGTALVQSIRYRTLRGQGANIVQGSLMVGALTMFEFMVLFRKR